MNFRLSFKNIVYIYSGAFLLMCVISFMIMFFSAFFGGSMMSIAAFNLYNEARLEFVLFTIGILAVLMRIYYEVK